MGKRRKSREYTLQVLFQIEFNNSKPEKIQEQYWKNKKVPEEIKKYSVWLLNGVISYREKIDDIIQSVSENWRVSRMAVVDRNILRIAVLELFFGENLAPAIVINEAIEIAKKFSSEKSAAFINGILDALRKESDKIKVSLKEEKNG